METCLGHWQNRIMWGDRQVSITRPSHSDHSPSPLPWDSLLSGLVPTAEPQRRVLLGEPRQQTSELTCVQLITSLPLQLLRRELWFHFYVINYIINLNQMFENLRTFTFCTIIKKKETVTTGSSSPYGGQGKAGVVPRAIHDSPGLWKRWSTTPWQTT